MPVDGYYADDHNDEGRYHCGERFVHPQTVQDVVKNASEYASGSVNLLLQDKRYLIGQDIPDNSAGRCGHDPHHNGDQESGVVFQSLSGADNEECSQAEGVKIEQGPVNEVEAVVKIEDKKGHNNGEVKVVFILEAKWRNSAEEKIPDRSASNGGDQGEDDDAQKVHSSLNTGERPRCGKGGCTQEIEEV